MRFCVWVWWNFVKVFQHFLKDFCVKFPSITFGNADFMNFFFTKFDFVKTLWIEHLCITYHMHYHEKATCISSAIALLGYLCCIFRKLWIEAFAIICASNVLTHCTFYHLSSLHECSVFIVSFYSSLLQIKRVDLRSSEFRASIQPYTLTNTDHFLHEFRQFAMSPLDMANFDKYAKYPREPRGIRNRLHPEIPNLFLGSEPAHRIDFSQPPARTNITQPPR